MKLHAKLLLLLVPLIAAPLAAFGWVAYTQQRDSMEQESLRQMQTLLDQIEHVVGAQFEAARTTVSLLAENDLLHRYLNVADEGERFRLLQPALLKVFRTYQKANPHFYEIRVLLPDGYEDTRSTLTPIPNATDEEGASDYFDEIRLRKRAITMQVIRNPDNGATALLVSRAIVTTDPGVDPTVARMYANQHEHDPSNLAASRELASDEDTIPIGLLYRNPQARRYDEITVRGLKMPVAEKIQALEHELDRFAI